MNIEFKQTQVVGSSGSIPMIMLHDKDRHLTVEWAPARLECWLQGVRDNEIDPHELLDPDISWKENDTNDRNTDLLNTSRISLNISLIKDNFLCTPDKPTFEKTASDYINIIETNANLLQSLAHEQASRRISETVTQSVEQIKSLLNNLKIEIYPKSNPRSTKTVRFLLD